MVDSAAFRQGMAQFAASVTLITSDGDAGLAGGNRLLRHIGVR